MRRAPRRTSWPRPRARATSSSSCRCAASTMPWARPPRCWSAHRLPDAWLTLYPGVREHEPLQPYSWYGIGGRARYFLDLADDTALPELVGRLNRDQVPYLVIGAATNTLFATDEVPGLTIKLSTPRISTDGDAVSVSAGTLMPKLAAEMAKAGRAGLEFGAGVPGTVGGSGFGNAGALGGGGKDRVPRAGGGGPQGPRPGVTGGGGRLRHRGFGFQRTRGPWGVPPAGVGGRPEPP